jgi:hypothetical protein
MNNYTRWFKYDRDKLRLVYTQNVPVIFEPPCSMQYRKRILSRFQQMSCACLHNFRDR